MNQARAENLVVLGAVLYSLTKDPEEGFPLSAEQTNKLDKYLERVDEVSKEADESEFTNKMDPQELLFEQAEKLYQESFRLEREELGLSKEGKDHGDH